MKVVICYFSGTGNTAKIVQLYRENFAKHGASIDLYAMEDLIVNVLNEEFLNKLNDADLL